RMISELWGHRKGRGAGNGKTGASEGAVREANPPCKAEALSGANISSEAPAPGCREKPLSCIMRPYRRPTQVDEEQILRPAGEVLLRNSAKRPHNFGRRAAPITGGHRELAQATV